MRCRPGDLAVITFAFNSVNIGRVVNVLRVDDGHGKLRIEGFGPVWIVSCAQPLRWLLPNGRRVEAREGPAPDRWLQPIRGLPRSTTTTIEEVSHDHA